MLVSSASTTNTREIKNRFRPEPVDRPERAIVCVEKKNPGGTAPKLHKNCQNETKKYFFCGFFFHVYMIFCLWFFLFTIFCLLSSFCSDKYTKNYYYIHTVFWRFLFVFVLQYFFSIVFQYILLAVHGVQWTPATSRYKFWDMDFASAALRFNKIRCYIYWFN